MRLTGSPEKVEVVETQPHEFLLDPLHPYKELRGTKYFETGSVTLATLSQLANSLSEILAKNIDFEGDSLSCRYPRGILLTGLFTNMRHLSLDHLAFIRGTMKSWKEAGYSIAYMPPKTRNREYKTYYIYTHCLPPCKRPKIVYAYLGSNNRYIKKGLAKALYDYGLATKEEVGEHDTIAGHWPIKE